MKVTAGKAESFLRNAPGDLLAYLFYGPDQGLARERVREVARRVAEDLRDPFRLIRLGPAELKAEPTRLADELLATSLMGGRRAVWLEGAGDGQTAAVKAALELDPQPEHVLLIDAGELAGRSKLRLLFEQAKHAAAVPCYADDARSLGDLVNQTLSEAGLMASQDVRRAIVARLGADRALSRRELEKLVLYKGTGGELSHEDVEHVLADAAEHAIDSWLYTVSGGQVARADAALHALLAEGQAPILLANALHRHFARLHQVVAAHAEGLSRDKAIATLRPPLFWKVKTRFAEQVERLPLDFFPPVLAKLDDTAKALRLSSAEGASLLSQASLALTSRVRRL